MSGDDDVSASAAADDAGEHAGEPVVGPPTSGLPADPPVLPNQRVVSDDELLDLDAGPSDDGPLVRLAGLLSLTGRPAPHRLQRLFRVALVVLAVVGVAGAAGVATHTADVHRAQDRLRNRTLLRLVGGSALVGFPGSVPLGGGPIKTHLDFSLRNDGAQPEQARPLSIDAPGVKVAAVAAPVVIPPGTSATLRLSVMVDCSSTALVKQPNSVIVQASPYLPTEASAHTASATTSRPTTLTLPFAVGSRPQGPGGPLAGEGQTVDTFYQLCGMAQLSDNGPVTSYLGLSSKATPTKPTATFQFAVRSDGNGSDAVLTTQEPTHHADLGLTVLGELPAAPAPLKDATPVQAGVTVQVTDCAALSTALSAENGLDSVLGLLGEQLPLAIEPADPRFRDALSPGLVMLTGDVSAFEHDLLVSLVAACPALK